MTDRSVVLRIRADIADAQRKIGSLSGAVKSNAQQIQAAGQDWDRLGDKAARAGLVGAAGLGLVTKQAIDWESAWAGVNKTVDGSAAQMGELEEGLRDLATTLPSTHQEIAAVAEAAGQLGVARDDILGFTRTMVDLGESTNLSADEAATAIAQISNVMGTMDREGTDGVSRFGAALVELGNNGASTERDILNMASRIAGAGKVVGLTEPELLAISNALASVGIEAEAGGTAVSKVLIDMSKAVQTGSTELALFAKVAGMSTEAFKTLFADSPAKALDAFSQGLGRIKAEGGDVFTTLGDLGQSDVRVSTALLKMAGAGDLLTDSLAQGNQAWQENNALTEEAAKRYETSASRIKVARNAITDAGIDAGGAIAPAVTEAAEAVGSLARGFSDLGESTQNNIVYLAVATTGVALFGAAAIKTTTSLAAMKAAMVAADGSTTAMGKAAGAAAKGLGILAAAAASAALQQYLADARVAKVETEGLTDAIAGLNDQTQRAPGLLADLFRTPDGLLSAQEEVVTMTEVVERFQDSAKGSFAGFGDGLEGIDAALGRMQDGGAIVAKFSAQAGQLDTALAQMVSSGRRAEAEAFFNAILDGLDPAIVDEVKTSFTEYGAALKELPAQAEPAGTAAREMASALGETATEAEEAAYSVSEYVEALQKLNQPQLDAREAARQVQEALQGTKDVVDDVREALRRKAEEDGKGEEAAKKWADAQVKAGAGLNKAKTDFDISTEAGRLYQTALDEVASKLASQIGVLAEAGASQEELDAKLRTSRTVLYETAVEMGLTKDAAKKYVEAVLGIPAAKATTITVNTSEATSAVVRLQEQINSMRGNTLKIGIRYVEEDKPGGGTSFAGGITQGAATGGAIYGPGSGTSDTAGVWRLSNGEHVWTAAEVNALGGQEEMYRLRAMVASGQLGGFATGGEVNRYGTPGSAPIDLSRYASAATTSGNGESRSITHHSPVIVERMEVADYTDFRAQEEKERRMHKVGGGL